MKKDFKSFYIYLTLSICLSIGGCVLMAVSVLLGLFVLSVGIAMIFTHVIPTYDAANASITSTTQTEKLLAEAFKIQLQETIEHFKVFFKKYGYYPSKEDLAKIITRYAQASTDEEQFIIIHTAIPDVIPTVEKFKSEVAYNMDRILPKGKNSVVANSIKNVWQFDASALTDLDVKQLYDAQKDATKDAPIFRFNYEYPSIMLIISICEDLEERSSEYDEVNNDILNFMNNVKDYAYSLGYHD